MDSFECSKCGTCCRWSGYVHIEEKDIKRISAFLHIDEQDFIDKYTCLTSNRQGLSIIENPDGSCIFLNNENQCEIYSVRPRQCKEFPHKWRLNNMDGCQSYRK